MDERTATNSDSTGGWWSHPVTLFVVMAASVVPLLFTPIPPLRDLPGHMSRYYIIAELANSEALRRNWDFHWFLFPNLGLDLLVTPFAHAFGVERVTWIAAAVLAPLMILGFYNMARAVHGVAPPTWLASVPFAMAEQYHFGFLNFWLSMAMALNMFAWWVSTKERGAALPIPLFFISLSTLTLWLAHFYGWAILIMLVGGYEASRVWTFSIRQWPRMIGLVLWRSLPVFLPLVVMLVLMPSASAGSYWISWRMKVLAIIHALRDQDLILDGLSLLLVIALIALPLLTRRIRFARRLLITVIALAVIWVPMPHLLMGSYYADTRLVPFIFAFVVLSLAPVALRRRELNGLAMISAAMVAARIAFETVGFSAYARDYDRYLGALDHIEPGSRIVVLSGMACARSWRSPRLDHIDSMAIIRKDAFVNTQWSGIGTNPLIAKGGTGTPFEADPSQFIDRQGDCNLDLVPVLREKLAAVPHDRFQYVWLIGFSDDVLHVMASEPGFETLYSNPGGLLLGVN